MRIVLAGIFLLGSQWVFSQFTIQPIAGSTTIRQTDFRVVSLPFWDDFSTSTGRPDTLLWKAGDDVYINSSLAINTPTLNVATFDGLTGTGAMHGGDTDFNGPTDSLASQIIDLTPAAAQNPETIFLSFYWQGKGNGERPDEIDSLLLQFLNDTLEWQTVWKKLGTDIVSDSTFTQEIIQIVPPYIHQNFRFRFQAYGRPSGPFDTWHIDYVYLNSNRNAGDLSHFDRALSGQPTSPFSPYHIIPAEVLFQNPTLFKGQQFLATNLDSQPNPLQLVTSVRNLTTSETYGEFPSDQNAYLPFEFRTVTSDTLLGASIPSQIAPLDSQVLEVKHYINSGDKFLFEEVVGTDTLFLPINLKINDTITTQLLLHDYYAYDDGTAEYAAGLNERNSKLAIKYVLFEQDTLTHIDLHFPTIIPSAAGKTINVMIWRRLFPQEQLLQYISHPITANTQLNQFQRVKLVKPIVVTDTLYIGFQQVVQDYVPIGLDRNNPSSMNAYGGTVYTKTSEDWVLNERIIGAFMIRPVFSPASDFVLSNPLQQPELVIYPNPTKGLVQFSRSFEKIVVMDLSGKTIQTGSGSSLNFSGEPGVYILHLHAEDELILKKIVFHK